MKVMKLSPDAVSYLSSRKMFNGAFDSKTIAGIPIPADVPRKIKIVVHPMAYLKMVRLIIFFQTEVGWHGLIQRSNEDPSKFILSDVMVYPQNVTGSTITTDEVRMTEWLDRFPDESFRQIRFHGHSHVNMGVFSSGTDDDLQRDLVEMMTNPDDFYLFFIMNKRLELFIRLYDNKFGVMYETADCEVEIVDEETDLTAFIADAYQQVKPVAVTSATNNQKTAGASSGKSTSITPPTKQSYPDDYPLGYWEDDYWAKCEGRYYQ